jgi:starch-binding outer membrane protein, SusD/RagB family
MKPENFILNGKALKYITVLLSLVLLSSCDDFVEIDPPKDQIINETVFTNDGAAISAIRGIYSQMIREDGFSNGGRGSLTYRAGLSADELVYHAALEEYIEFFNNSLLPTNSGVNNSFWNKPYKFIYHVNSILEGLSRSTLITDKVKEQVEGEAKFIRAFCYFYLANLFGDVPLILTTDYRTNRNAYRTPNSQVYQQIISDLLDAQSKLALDYSYSNNQRVQPNRWAALALLARTYLYVNDWPRAETIASEIIDNHTAFSLVNDLNSVFLKNSSEAIWQLLPLSSSFNTHEGSAFIITGVPVEVSLSNELLESFEIGDERKTNWVKSFSSDDLTYYYPFKYKIRTGINPLNEYSMVLRLAEQYLIRAEARTQLDNISGAQEDVNKIRNRAGLLNTEADTQEELLLAIEQERRIEFFAEWGHRWLDLKRMNRADAILGTVKSNWQSTDLLYPIPQTEIDNAPNLKPQNLGY